MPVEFEILSEPDVVLVRYVGEMSAGDVIDSFKRYAAEPGFRLDRPQMVDTTRVTSTGAGFSDIFKVFSMFARAFEDGTSVFRTAIIADNEINFGIARIFQNLAETNEHIEAELFRTRDEALAWIAGMAPDERDDWSTRLRNG